MAAADPAIRIAHSQGRVGPRVQSENGIGTSECRASAQVQQVGLLFELLVHQKESPCRGHPYVLADKQRAAPGTRVEAERPDRQIARPLGRAICQKHFGTGWLDGVPCGDRPDERVAVWEEELGLGLL